jgi:hypothetical protein
MRSFQLIASSGAYGIDRRLGLVLCAVRIRWFGAATAVDVPVGVSARAGGRVVGLPSTAPG